jgi:lipopolysaccharide/colanic/teichoic acid biosynthesis glycosyltransferase
MQVAAEPHQRILEVTQVEGKDRDHYYPLKRLLDLVIAALALLGLAPLLLGIALLVRLDSPGPAFFVQERIGSRRRTSAGRTVWEIRKFNIVKYRSMVRDADPAIHRAHVKDFVAGSLEKPSQAGSGYKLTHDARVTRIGHFLRRTSLDELPQLVNVLRGDMSLIGPRPVPEYEIAEYPEAWCFDRLATLPGMTGLWQVTARSQADFAEMVRLDREYVRRQSLWLDLKILLLTIPAVLSGKGAE